MHDRIVPASRFAYCYRDCVVWRKISSLVICPELSSFLFSRNTGGALDMGPNRIRLPCNKSRPKGFYSDFMANSSDVLLVRIHLVEQFH
jgi:hypothetical protein